MRSPQATARGGDRLQRFGPWGGRGPLAFEEQIARDIVFAERFRALLLASIFTVALFALVFAAGVYPEIVVALLHGNVEVAPVGLFLMAVAAFEFFELGWLARRLRRGEVPRTVHRYAQAFFETSLPTVAIVYYAAIDGPARALLMPASFVYFVFIVLATLRLDFALCTFTGLVAAIEYGAIALFWETPAAASTGLPEVDLASHLGKASILLVSGVAAGFVAERLRRSFAHAIESVSERQRILDVFGQHVSPQIVERLVAGKAEVRSELADVCVMFLDIRNFTAFAESKTPAEVVDYLNTVFASTIDAVVTRHGIVNKFLGDGFMAVFGAPMTESDACGAAVDAALDIVGRVESLALAGKVPPTRVGIGLHAGKAVVGNIGSTQRKEYTVIGDVVNVASRIEALNKELGTQVLASEEAWLASGRAHPNAVQHEVVIRGRQKPVKVWQLA